MKRQGFTQRGFTDLEIDWSDITGLISSNTDLQNALDAKEYVLTAGANINIDRTNPLVPIISSTGGSSTEGYSKSFLLGGM